VDQDGRASGALCGLGRATAGQPEKAAGQGTIRPGAGQLPDNLASTSHIAGKSGPFTVTNSYGACLFGAGSTVVSAEIPAQQALNLSGSP
jgi:hypothetical protein